MGSFLGYYVMPHPPIVIPEIGRGEENKIINTINACKKVGEEIATLKPDAIIIITPHGPVFRDAIAISRCDSLSGDLSDFGAPQLRFNYNNNLDLVNTIGMCASNMGIKTVGIEADRAEIYDVSCQLDHGSMVPLYFINEKYSDFDLVRITYGFLNKIDLYKFGTAIKEAVDMCNLNVVFIASGDLSHRLKGDGPYKYSPMGKVFDEKIIELLEKGDVKSIFSLDNRIVNEAGECGLRSFYIMLGAMTKREIIGELLSYEGTFGVGYGVLKFNTKENPQKNTLDNLLQEKAKQVESLRTKEDTYVKLARESLEYYVREGKPLPVPNNLPSEMLNDKRGVFVSLKKEGELRGCIGTIAPTTDSLAKEIIRNAVEAGERDPRFFPVEEDELDDIVYSVDVLMPPEESNKEDLDPEKYGVIVKHGRKMGLLLPDLEGVDTPEKQLEIALDKAGISPDRQYEIERFEVVRHK
ncbi:MAG: AmmeMemoRadiSam system protein A [Bacillota bacterium]|nr:AmmeMemoRadiSam system protein A [Bacillota bacterium]